MDSNTRAVLEVVSNELRVPFDSLPIDASAENVPEWDSLAQLKICMSFQERFGVEMDMERIEHCSSVESLAALLPTRA